MCALFAKLSVYLHGANIFVCKGILHQLHHCLAAPSKLTQEAHPLTGAGEKNLNKMNYIF